MRIAVISDLHIGAEDFRPDGFGEFLDHLEREHDEIMLLGDVFECYFPRAALEGAGRIRSLRSALP